MSVFDDSPRPVLTTAQKQSRTAKLIRNRLATLEKSHYQQYQEILKLRSDNPMGLTPAEVDASLGADLPEYQAFHAKVQELFALLPPALKT